MEPFKNLLNAAAARRIANAIKRGYPAFNTSRFLKDVESGLAPLELKQRSQYLKRRLREGLPSLPRESFPILIAALKIDEEDATGLEGFEAWPLSHYVMEEGMTGKEHLDLSLRTLHVMTKAFSSEFAVRPFLIHYPIQTLTYFEKWSHDPSEHVRRLVSEGSRPLLPWGERIPAFVKDPKLTWHLLEVLQHDPSNYVQKSVANHLNDHSKNHGDWLVTKLKQWQKQKHNPWIIKHALRTLIKKGHTGALALHGYKATDALEVTMKLKTPSIPVGGELHMTAAIKNKSNKRVSALLDHEILFLKSNGLLNAKVFKGQKLEIEPHANVNLDLKLKIRPVTTRKYYPGKQGWRLVLNGAKLKQFWFKLV